MKFGTVKFFNATKGFGIIIPGGHEKADTYFNRQDAKVVELTPSSGPRLTTGKLRPPKTGDRIVYTQAPRIRDDRGPKASGWTYEDFWMSAHEAAGYCPYCGLKLPEEVCPK